MTAYSIKPPVLVLGATDGLGFGLVEAGLEAGYPVLAVDADQSQLDTLAQRFGVRGKLSTLAGAVVSDADAADLASSLRELSVRPLVAIVNLHIACERGRLLEHDADLLERTLQKEVFPYMHAARHLLPMLAETGRCARYLVIGGPQGDTSWLGYGHHSVAAAATRMLVRALRRETEGSPVRVQQLVIGKPVRTEENASCACPEWPDALSVGRYAIKVLTGNVMTGAVVRYETQSSGANVELAKSQTINR
jgi:NAD(P)-dependent dehydrogenase (short-subunit alcohol dehydrogenase family)